MQVDFRFEQSSPLTEEFQYSDLTLNFLLLPSGIQLKQKFILRWSNTSVWRYVIGKGSFQAKHSFISTPVDVFIFDIDILIQFITINEALKYCNSSKEIQGRFRFESWNYWFLSLLNLPFLLLTIHPKLYLNFVKIYIKHIKFWKLNNK